MKGLFKAFKVLKRTIYQDYNSSFAEPVRKDSSLTIHQRNLTLLITEMFKVKIGCAPDIIREIFEMIIKITTSGILFN